MGRILKFRGKPIGEGQFIYGNLSYREEDGREYYAIQEQNFEGREYEVDPETVGQFTGLYSANKDFLENPNKKAFFGDIIRFYNTEGYEFIHAIEWDENLCCISIGGRAYSRIYESGYFQPSKLEFEIIGNIHDNPELLKTDNNETI